MKLRAWILSIALLVATGIGVVELTVFVRKPFIDPAEGRSLPVQANPISKTKPHERFVVFGDFGTGGAGQRTVARAVSDRAKQDGLDFVILAGDNFYPRGVSSVNDPQWKTEFENMYGSLNVPFYVALGNHDYNGNPDAEIAYGKKDPKWKMPARYYATTRTLKDGTTIKLIIIDTMAIINGHGDAQLLWLDKELDDPGARWKIVAGHHPVFSHGRHGDTPILKEKLKPILERRRADVYFCGHDHTLEMLKPVNGVNYIVSGGGAGKDNAYSAKWSDACQYVATGGGFVEATIGHDDLYIAFVRPNERIQFGQDIAKTSVR